LESTTASDWGTIWEGAEITRTHAAKTG